MCLEELSLFLSLTVSTVYVNWPTVAKWEVTLPEWSNIFHEAHHSLYLLVFVANPTDHFQTQTPQHQASLPFSPHGTPGITTKLARSLLEIINGKVISSPTEPENDMKSFYTIICFSMLYIYIS